MPVNTDIGKYRETGHCLVPNHAEPEILAGIREDVLKAIEARNRKLAKQPSKTKYYRHWAFGLHETSEWVAGYLRGGPFPGLVASVLGGDADLQFTSTMTKTREMAAALDWHQDAVYDKDPDHAKFSLWISITDSKRDNGCLRIIPGTHPFELAQRERPAANGVDCRLHAAQAGVPGFREGHRLQVP